ncbi:MAG: type II secretion system protein GspJ [Polyangiaceae bacterium]|jgi:general secretion pathway protein J
MRTRARKRARARGMTLLEIMVSVAILAMVAVLIYGAFDSMARGKKGEEMRSDRSREGREAILRITRELSSAFISMHNPANTALITRATAFIGSSGGVYDRIDFAAFAHRRVERDSHESDECEVGYFVVRDPDVEGKMDLVRREQTPIDTDPKKGGVVNVVAENVDEFDIKYLEPLTSQWVDTWDSTQVTGQPGRLPLEVSIRLVLKGIGDAPAATYATKLTMPMQQPLTFGIPR